MRHVLILLMVGMFLGGCLAPEKSVSSGDGANLEQRSGNRSPTISGNPQAAIMFGDFYDFEPQASDPDGDSLSFRIQNKPSWAIFDESTGRLSGQPTLGDVGVYSNILISVSDGTSTQSLRAFSITVSQSALGSVTLNWIAPTENTDNSPLLDLAGYKIYYGRSSGEYTHEIRIINAGLTTYVVDNLVAGTYYFAATAFNSANVESEFSGEAVKIVN
jgi:hypothetical protein